MEENMSRKRQSIFWPLLLVAVGAILLLTNLDAVPGNLWDYFVTYWPVLFILSGLDQIYQGKSWVGAVILLGLGGVLLAGNLNALPWSGLDLLLRLWPVLIVAAGLDLLMQGRTSTFGAEIIVFLALALVAGMVWIGLATPASMGQAPMAINQPLENAQSASVAITVIAGDVKVTGGAERDQLIAGTVFTPSSMQMVESYAVSGGEGRYELTPESGARVPVVGTYHGKPTELNLNSAIPMEFDFTLIAGEQAVDLRNTHVSDLAVETILGKTVVTLPKDQRLTGKISSIIGELIIRVPRGASVEFQMDTVISGRDMPGDFLKTEERITSPEAADGRADIVISLENVIGSVKIEYLP